MKKNIYILLTAVVFASCTSTSNIMDFNYMGEDNYKNIYIVDTIEIKQPITIHYGNSKFVVSRNTLLKQKQLTNNFFLRPDVFVLRSNIYRDFSSKDVKSYTFAKTPYCELGELVKIGGYSTREFKCDSVKFILGLINVNYYNTHFNSENYYQIRQKNQKINYFKIVYPLCK